MINNNRANIVITLRLSLIPDAKSWFFVVYIGIMIEHQDTWNKPVILKARIRLGLQSNLPWFKIDDRKLILRWDLSSCPKKSVRSFLTFHRHCSSFFNECENSGIRPDIMRWKTIRNAEETFFPLKKEKEKSQYQLYINI